MAYKADIEAAADPEAERTRIEQRVRALCSPFRSAEAFVVEDIIDPADTRAAGRIRQPGGTAARARAYRIQLPPLIHLSHHRP